MHRVAYLAAICLTGLALTAPAAQARIMRPGDGLRMAEKALPSKCAGRTVILEDATLPDRGALGEATGMVFDDALGRWRTERCEFSVLPGLDPAVRCEAEIHEYLHIALEQGEHVGIMAPQTLDSLTWKMCNPPLTRREEAIDMIRETLKNPDAWVIKCSKFKRGKMSCRALKGTKVRRYQAVFEAGTVVLKYR